MVRFLSVSVLLLLPSIFGRTPFLSFLKPYLIETTKLSEATFSFSYSCGTLLASFLVPLFVCCLGRYFKLTQIFRSIYSLFLIGLLCFFSATQISSLPLLNFLLLTLGYILLRFCGQGLLPTFTRTYTALVYDDKSCAWFATFHTTILVCVTGISLFFLSHLTLHLKGQLVLGYQASILILILFFIPQKLPAISSLEIHSFKKFHFTFQQFPIFFKYGMFIVAFQNLQATAISFHLSNFAQENSIDLSLIFKVFLPMSLLELLFNPGISWLYTHVSIKRLLKLLIFNLILLNVSLIFLTHRFAIFIFIFSSALGWSCNHVLSYSLPAHYLSKEKQAIGFATFSSWVSIFSAMGPFFYSFIATIIGEYTYTAYAMCLLNGLLLLVFTFTKKNSSVCPS